MLVKLKKMDNFQTKCYLHNLRREYRKLKWYQLYRKWVIIQKAKAVCYFAEFDYSRFKPTKREKYKNVKL
jgi:hypothetical protein